MASGQHVSGRGGTGDSITDVQPADLQQLRDAVMSIWTKTSEECFQHLVENVPPGTKAVLNAKGGLTFYWSVSVYFKL